MGGERAVRCRGRLPLADDLARKAAPGDNCGAKHIGQAGTRPPSLGVGEGRPGRLGRGLSGLGHGADRRCGLGSRRGLTRSTQARALPVKSRQGQHNQKGELDLHSKTRDGKEVYDSWNDKMRRRGSRQVVFVGQGRRENALRGAESRGLAV